eukprot:CAMPEP_0182856690 /NCGR_PEP_ID=MMETSP0034_2-20130328/2594_1 /TAXON_ID=156128 /ORGANISM="Nephroselmis pyriformis, Strain CCMP717" /LENGTH=54 /DNA_ID=CAMNT_0024987813 /DNA_START=228 /DNA_END=389 /DNA_ORIENTATION=-
MPSRQLQNLAFSTVIISLFQRSQSRFFNGHMQPPSQAAAAAGAAAVWRHRLRAR